MHKAFRDRPSRDIMANMAELSRIVVNTGALQFVRFHISITVLHTLNAWVHQDMVWGAFLASVVEDYENLGWFGNDKRTTTQRVIAATVRHSEFSPTSSPDWFLPRFPG